MPTEITVRPARSEDRSRWRQLWRDYCAVFDAVVPDEVTEGVWQRISRVGDASTGMRTRTIIAPAPSTTSCPGERITFGMT